MFNFCQKWLTGIGIYLAIFGIILAIFPQSALMNFLFNNQIDPGFWVDGQLPANATYFQAWIYGVLGATVSGWGILLASIAFIPFKKKEKWAWNSLAGAIGFWYVVDTLISAVYRVEFNAIFNTLILLSAAIPLALTRRQFVQKR